MFTNIILMNQNKIINIKLFLYKKVNIKLFSMYIWKHFKV